MNDFENRLRAHLAEQARRAPDGDALAEQIIARLDHSVITPIDKHRQWRTWTFPLIAAAAVAAVALALVGVSHLGRTPAHPVAGHTSIRPTPTHVHSTTPSPPASSPTATAARETVAAQDGTQLLSNVHVLDLSFVSNDDGWALATADCLGATSPGRTCTAMLRTTNGGTTWRGMPTPPANVAIGTSCAAPCIQHIRFATDQIGYAFGSAALFMTKNGGTSWTAQRGGADALETLDGNVIRVSTTCLPGCPYQVQIANLGSSTWSPIALPGSQADMNSGVSLARTGASAFIDIYGHVAGGAGKATSVLYTSTDDGASWTRRGEPCPQVGRGAAGSEVDSTNMTSAADGSLTLLCTPRSGQGPQFTTTSTDGGATFHHGAIDALGAAPVSALGAATSSELFVSSDDTYRSTDGGRTWTRQHANGRSGPAQLSWFGFESSTAGRAVSADGSTIWTTQDAGVTWTAHTFG